MDTVTVVGTASSEDTLTVFGHPIAVHHLPKKKAGKRVKVTGELLFTHDAGAFLQIRNWEETDEPDCNEVVVSGTVMGILPPVEREGGKRSACVILRQNDSNSSRMLLTVIGSRIEEVGIGNLSTGQQLKVRGYITYHKRGLHVLYAGKEV